MGLGGIGSWARWFLKLHESQMFYNSMIPDGFIISFNILLPALKIIFPNPSRFRSERLIVV